MIRTYLKSALRNLRSESTNTIINLAGLTLGITGSLILFLIIHHGTSFDQYHAKKDQIYRIVTKSKDNNGYSFTQGIPAALPEAFKDEFGEAEEVAFTSYRRDNLISVIQNNGNVKKYEEPKGVVFTQPSFFKIFDRKILIGSADKALDDPNEAVISKKWALKYFGNEDVVGQTLSFENIEYKISAVMEDFPINTDLPFELMLSSVTIKKQLEDRGWGNIADTDNCYVLLSKGVQGNSVEDKTAAFVKKYLGAEAVDKTSFIMQPLRDLHSDMRFGNYNTKLPKMAQTIFSAIALFLLITACVNFVNLATAESIKRSKEVGIRKVLGSSRSQLIYQFLSEAFVIASLATLLSLATTEIFLGFINSYMEMSLALELTDPAIYIFLGTLVITITLFAGLYPALVISGFKPVQALKNQITSKGSSGYTLRRSLIVLQFFISQFFIIGTIVLTRQMDFMQKVDIGFAKDAIITIPIPSTEKIEATQVSDKIKTLKKEVVNLPGVEQASLNYAPPSFKAVLGTGFKMAGSEEEFNTQIKPVDGDYIELYKIQLLAGGKLPDADSAMDVVVNEELARVAGFQNPDAIVGKVISLWGKDLVVKGVAKNFFTQSLSHQIEPVILINNINDYHSLSVKLNPSDMQSTIALIQDKWEAAYPEYIFNYNFIDVQISDLYRGERKLSFLLNVFSFIAIFIGCLGLFGLVTFMANQKTKEIGIRKVLGASVESVLILFSKEFSKLIIIGFILSAPLAGFLMNMMLEEFAYKISLGPVIFLTALGVTFLLALVTVGYRAFRASTVNPVESLKSE